MASIGNRWKAELVSRKPAGSVKWPSLMYCRVASASRRYSASCSAESRPTTSWAAPSSSAIRVSNASSESTALTCDSPISLTTPEPENFS